MSKEKQATEEMPSAAAPNGAHPSQPSPSINRLIRFLPLIIFVVAFAFRLIGIGWGLPNDLHEQSYHPDETPNWMFAQQIEPAKLDFTPGSYSYGTLYLTLLRVASDVVKGYGGGPVEGHPESNWTYIGNCIFAGRILSAVFGALAAAIAFAIFRRWMRPMSATLGALVLAFAPGFVVHSRFATVDVLATLLIVVSAYFALKILPSEELDAKAELLLGKQRLKWAILAGVFAGLSAGTKYTGILALFTLFAVLILHRKPGNLVAGILGTISSVLAFIVSTPGAIFDQEHFWRDFSREMEHAATGHGLVFIGRGSGFFVHIYNLIEGLGGALLLLCILGLAVAPKRLRAPLFALLAFAVVYYFVIGRSEVMFFRYTLPILLVLAFGFGALVEKGNESGGSAQRWAAGMAMLVLGGVPFWGGLRTAGVMSAWMAGEDPRDSAAILMKSKLEEDPNATVGLVRDPWYDTPPVFPDVGLPRPMFQRFFMATLETMRNYRLVMYVPTNPDERFDWDARLIDELHPTYITYSSFASNDLERLKNKKGLEPVVHLQVDRYLAFMKKLSENYEGFAMFGGESPDVHDLMYIRPTIWIWKQKATP